MTSEEMHNHLLAMDLPISLEFIETTMSANPDFHDYEIVWEWVQTRRKELQISKEDITPADARDVAKVYRVSEEYTLGCRNAIRRHNGAAAMYDLVLGIENLYEVYCRVLQEGGGLSVAQFREISSKYKVGGDYAAAKYIANMWAKEAGRTYDKELDIPYKDYIEAINKRQRKQNKEFTVAMDLHSALMEYLGMDVPEHKLLPVIEEFKLTANQEKMLAKLPDIAVRLQELGLC